MIIADSFGQPRYQDEIKMAYKQTWPYLLSEYFREKKDEELPILANYGFDTNQLVNTLKYYELFESKTVFLQLGIVDCSRRAISKKTLRIVKRIPVLNKIVWKITNKYHSQLTKLYNITYTTKDKYYKNIEKFIKNNSNVTIYLLPIFSVGKKMQLKSYNIQLQISEYNQKLEELDQKYSKVTFLSSLIDPLSENIEFLTFSDDYHLNIDGQEVLFKEIIKLIK